MLTRLRLDLRQAILILYNPYCQKQETGLAASGSVYILVSRHLVGVPGVTTIAQLALAQISLG
jgi:hypothetical protein